MPEQKALISHQKIDSTGSTGHTFVNELKKPLVESQYQEIGIRQVLEGFLLAVSELHANTKTNRKKKYCQDLIDILDSLVPCYNKITSQQLKVLAETIKELTHKYYNKKSSYIRSGSAKQTSAVKKEGTVAATVAEYYTKISDLVDKENQNDNKVNEIYFGFEFLQILLPKIYNQSDIATNKHLIVMIKSLMSEYNDKLSGFIKLSSCKEFWTNLRDNINSQYYSNFSMTEEAIFCLANLLGIDTTDHPSIPLLASKILICLKTQVLVGENVHHNLFDLAKVVELREEDVYNLLKQTSIVGKIRYLIKLRKDGLDKVNEKSLLYTVQSDSDISEEYIKEVENYFDIEQVKSILDTLKYEKISDFMKRYAPVNDNKNKDSKSLELSCIGRNQYIINYFDFQENLSKLGKDSIFGCNELAVIFNKFAVYAHIIGTLNSNLIFNEIFESKENNVKHVIEGNIDSLIMIVPTFANKLIFNNKSLVKLSKFVKLAEIVQKIQMVSGGNDSVLSRSLQDIVKNEGISSKLTRTLGV